jgi:hypothetical protein
VVRADGAVATAVSAGGRNQARQEKEADHLLSGTVQQVLG